VSNIAFPQYRRLGLYIITTCDGHGAAYTIPSGSSLTHAGTLRAIVEWHDNGSFSQHDTQVALRPGDTVDIGWKNGRPYPIISSRDVISVIADLAEEEP
jgi:hypothetical protein